MDLVACPQLRARMTIAACVARRARSIRAQGKEGTPFIFGADPFCRTCELGRVRAEGQAVDATTPAPASPCPQAPASTPAPAVVAGKRAEPVRRKRPAPLTPDTPERAARRARAHRDLSRAGLCEWPGCDEPTRTSPKGAAPKFCPFHLPIHKRAIAVGVRRREQERRKAARRAARKEAA